jgi:hypothetical protein
VPISISKGQERVTESGERTVIKGTLSNSGTYKNSGTVVVTIGGIEIRPISKKTGDIVSNCDVILVGSGISKNTGSPPSPVSFGKAGGKISIKTDSDKGKLYKRYLNVEVDVDTSVDVVEVQLEEKINLSTTGGA